MNNPPAAAGGIVGIFLVFGRLGMNDPPAAAGGIYKASACVKTDGRRQISGVSTAENASLDLWVNQWLTLPVLYRLTRLTPPKDFRRDVLSRPYWPDATRARRIGRTLSSTHARSVRRCGLRSGSAPSCKPGCRLAAARLRAMTADSL